jgi:hypothetical protein
MKTLTLTLLLFALALAVRLPGLLAPMWYDEVFSWWLQHLPAAEMAAAIAGDVHPPLFYLSLFGTEPWQMRLKPLFFSLAGLWAVMQLAGFHFPAGSRGPLWVGVVYALSPFEVFYATELRMYMELQFFMLTMFVCIVHRLYWPAAAFGAVGLLLHHYAIIYIAAWGAVAWWGEIQKVRAERGDNGESVIWHWPLVAARRTWPMAGALVVLPATGLLAQSGAVAAGYWMWPPSLVDVLLLPGEFLFSAPFGNPGLSALTIIGGVVALGFVVWRGPRGLLPWLVGPVAVALMVSVLWKPIFQHRPLVAVAPLFYIALVAAIGTLRQRQRLWAAVVAAPVVVAVLLTPNTRAHYLSRVQAPAIMAAIGPLAPGSTIYHTAIYSRVELEQFAMPGVAHTLYPPTAGLGDGYTAQTRAALGIVEALPVDLTEPPDVVIIYRGYFYSPAAEAAARHLVADSAYRLVFDSQSETQMVQVFQRLP